MPQDRLTRRDVITRSLAAAALTLLESHRSARAQFGPSQPLHDDSLTLVSTTEDKPWQTGQLLAPAFRWDALNLNLSDKPQPTDGPPILGFGGCFNELGWTSLNSLAVPDRDAVLAELFHPTQGARFNYCRMPIAANDFATGPYSYDDVDGTDFDLQHFSIEHDRNTLIPFIHAALRQQPNLKLWASPWSPPAWMKRNHFYAEAKAYPGMKENGIRPDQVGHEGEDMFRLEPAYLEAYARYFGRFIDAYRAEGIPIGMVMPQNEFNSAQNFPSCTWTPAGLAQFLHHLGPQMQQRHVDIFFGTLERGNPALLEAVMRDPAAARYIRGFGTQWAGKNALPALHREFPNLILFQSEQECGDGSNSWSYTGYCWQLMKHYLRSGASAYMYWNIATPQGGMSTWGWAQNGLVSVDTTARTFHYNHDFYLLKHLTHYVDLGARCLETTGTCDDALAFRNPDGSHVLLVRNQLAHMQTVQVQLGAKSFAAELPADSISTIHIRNA